MTPLALAIFTRVPGAGPIKTRLAGAVGAPRAEALATAFLVDTLARVHELPVAHSLWYTPADAGLALFHLVSRHRRAHWSSRLDGEGEAPAEPTLTTQGSSAGGGREAAGPGPGAASPGKPLILLPQPRGPLDLRLATAIGNLLARGHDQVCVIGSDSPTLPLDRIEEAFEALITHDFVLVPAEDGGFVLLGARTGLSGVLAGIEWSTERVFAQSHLRLIEHGSVRVLDEGYDIDTSRDLIRLAADPELAFCPATRALLRPSH